MRSPCSVIPVPSRTGVSQVSSVALFRQDLGKAGSKVPHGSVQLYDPGGRISVPSSVVRTV